MPSPLQNANQANKEQQTRFLLPLPHDTCCSVLCALATPYGLQNALPTTAPLPSPVPSCTQTYMAVLSRQSLGMASRPSCT